MGIRFRCHHCEHELNLKNFQAGRRARCPSCSGRFRVPTISQDFSMPLEESEEQLAATSLGRGQSAAGEALPSFELQEPSDAAATQSQAPQQRSAGSASDRPAEPKAGGAESGIEMPRAVAEAPQAVWYVRPPSGGQFGPADGQTFFQWMKENRVARDALVWRDGWPQWMVAAEAFEDTYGSKWSIAAEAEDPAASIGDSPFAAGAGGRPVAAKNTASAADAAHSAADIAAHTADSTADNAADRAAGNAADRAAGNAADTANASGLAAAGGTSGERIDAPLVETSSVSGLPPRREPVSAARRKRIRNNYAIGISVLAVLAAALVMLLVYVVAMD